MKFGIPGEASQMFDAQLKRLSHFYANEREYVESLVAFSLCCELIEHHVLGPCFETRQKRQRMWEEIIAEFGQPTKFGAFFQRRMKEIAAERTSHTVAAGQRRKRGGISARE